MTIVPLVVDKLDPRTSTYIPKLMKIAGLIRNTTRMFVTTTDWQALIDELDAQHRGNLMDPTKPAPWGNNRPLQFGTKDPILYVINAGTDDERQVNYMNHETAKESQIADRVQELRSSINA